MSLSSRRQVAAFGATVKGPAHARDGVENQDAWSRANVAGGQVVIVSDGMGSKPHSALGATAACGAAQEALRTWLRHPQADPILLCALIHLLWRLRLPAGVEPEEAAATCLLVFLPKDGPGLAAQLGDGLILMETSGEVQPLVTRPSDHFGNETHALGVTRSVSAWRYGAIPDGPARAAICTDGVGDDLLPDSYGAFIAWMSKELAPLPPARRWQALARELRGWPTPGHIDDKTLCFIERH